MKTTLFCDYIEQRYPKVKVIAPQLPCKPAQALQLLQQLTKQYDFQGVIGSSLGGFLATYLHNNYQLPAVVVNPAVKPFDLLADYLGPQQHPITNEQYELTTQDMQLLKSLYQAKVAEPHQVWLLQQEKDEVLDFKQALDHYQDCKITFEQGGDHSFIGFDRFLGDIAEFLL